MRVFEKWSLWGWGLRGPDVVVKMRGFWRWPLKTRGFLHFCKNARITRKTRIKLPQKCCSGTECMHFYGVFVACGALGSCSIADFDAILRYSKDFVLLWLTMEWCQNVDLGAISRYSRRLLLFKHFLALAPEVDKMSSRRSDLSIFWPWLQKSTKWAPRGPI